MTPTMNPRVLVVDDNCDAANSMSDLLSIAGFEVETCYDGPSALAAADRFHPEACILDIAMPGMNGYELAQHLRERLPDHPPLLATITAYGDHAHLERAAAAGFDLQFTKPADPVEIIAELKRRIENSSPFTEAEGDLSGSPGNPDRKAALHRHLARLTGLWAAPSEPS